MLALPAQQHPFAYLSPLVHAALFERRLHFNCWLADGDNSLQQVMDDLLYLLIVFRFFT